MADPAAFTTPAAPVPITPPGNVPSFDPLIGPWLPALIPLPAVAPDERLFACEASVFAASVRDLVSGGWRFAMLAGTDDRPLGRGFAIEAVLAHPGQPVVRVRAALSAETPAYPSLGRLVPAALWDEREAHDLLGIVPIGHPDLRRLVLHDEFPDGVHPLRADAPAVPPPGRASVPYRPFVAQGEGVYDLPVGPIHAGVIEPGGFRFSAIGESILYLDARLFYTHRGIERLVEGLAVEAALPIVERSCGVCTVTHATAFAMAVERIGGPDADPPVRAVALRAILGELERVYNHIGDLGNICAGVAFNTGASQLAWLREQAQRINEGLTGHRFLMGIVAPGGLAFDVDAAALLAVPGRLRILRDQLDDVLAVLDGSEALRDRFERAGILPRGLAMDLGAVGPAARASGIAEDLRADLPSAVHQALGVPVATASAGDVAARIAVRRQELATSFDLLHALVAAVPRGDVRTPLPDLPGDASALGWAEGPRGASWLWLRTDIDGRVGRMHLRSASFANWPSVAAAAAGNLVPDFPLVNKSFELCYACTDR